MSFLTFFQVQTEFGTSAQKVKNLVKESGILATLNPSYVVNPQTVLYIQQFYESDDTYQLINAWKKVFISVKQGS